MGKYMNLYPALVSFELLIEAFFTCHLNFKETNLHVVTKPMSAYFREWPLRFVIHVIFVVQSWPDWVMFQRKLRALIDSCSDFLQFSRKLHSDVGRQNARCQMLHPIWCPISAGDVTQLDPACFISRINSGQSGSYCFPPNLCLTSFIRSRPFSSAHPF